MTDSTKEYKLPPIYAINEKLNGNPIQQLILPQQLIKGCEGDYFAQGIKGKIIRPLDTNEVPVLIVPVGTNPPSDFDRVLAEGEIRKGTSNTSYSLTWIKHPAVSKIPRKPLHYSSRLRQIITSWQNSFTYLEEDTQHKIKGLRTPQSGAIHAIHAHWATTNQAATIVMPTGTGKTETMVSILVSRQCQRLLVMVPTDALRSQIAEKFLTLGILKDFGAIAKKALYPIVGILKHKPKSVDELTAFFEKCNVIVTTAQIAAQCSDEIQDCMVQLCHYLFIDEAHHIAASTWHRFKEKFQQKKILQFTATPFRNDGKLVGGKIIVSTHFTRTQRLKSDPV